ANGCSATSADAAITVNPTPAAAVSGGGTFCAGGSATISATLTGTAPFAITWSDGVTQNVASGTTTSRTVSPSSTTTYTITSISDANCSGTASGSATVTVNTPAPATITAGGPTSFCPGGSVTLTANAGSSYAWS